MVDEVQESEITEEEVITKVAKKPVKKGAKKSGEPLSGWISLTPEQVSRLNEKGIGILGAKKNKDGLYETYYFKKHCYPQIARFLAKGGK